MFELIKNAFSDTDNNSKKNEDKGKELTEKAKKRREEIRKQLEEKYKDYDDKIKKDVEKIDFLIKSLIQQRRDLMEKVSYLENENQHLLLDNHKLSLDLARIQRLQVKQNRDKPKQDQQPNDNEWELIQRHRNRAPEFEALIQTLIHHSKEYDSNKQPLKKVVAETFKEKTNMTANTRRADEVARILGLPEKNNQ